MVSHDRPPSVSATAETPYQIALVRGRIALVSLAASIAAAATVPATPVPRRAIQKFGVSAETDPPGQDSGFANLPLIFAVPANSDSPNRLARWLVPEWPASSN